VQIGMALFMFCSIAWALLIFTDSLQMWHAAVLLLLHGCAGVFWGPPSQVLIHDIVGPAQLSSAVRLMATSRYLGLLAGPALGAAFFLVFGPVYGLALNALIYLPLMLWLWKAPYGPRFRAPSAVRPRAIRGIADIIETFREIRNNPIIVSMILLSGSASFFVANAYQAQMPEFGRDFGQAMQDFPGALLAADAAGALVCGVVLETRGLQPMRAPRSCSPCCGAAPSRPSRSVTLSLRWCCCSLWISGAFLQLDGARSSASRARRHPGPCYGFC
jgi:predicted MFS family arabinose efflux permease